MIANPNMIALRIPAAREGLRLVKKLTVNGIIGNIQGINKATKPNKKPSMKIPQVDADLISVGPPFS
ncbi:hypothetical protein D3C80_734660 [compost metagenome]